VVIGDVGWYYYEEQLEKDEHSFQYLPLVWNFELSPSPRRFSTLVVNIHDNNVCPC
jgi:hypothetical protein